MHIIQNLDIFLGAVAEAVVFHFGKDEAGEVGFKAIKDAILANIEVQEVKEKKSKKSGD